MPKNRYNLVIKRCQLLGAKKELFGVEKELFGAKIRSFSTNSKFILASSSLCETVKISVCYIGQMSANETFFNT